MPWSTDPLVNTIRSHRMCREVELLLSGFADSTIHSLSPALVKRWVLLPGDRRVACLQEYYAVPSRETSSTVFSALGETIPLVPPQELVGRRMRMVVWHRSR